ncbi:MAG: hypothetical protein M3O61_04770 [Gemmatimonadota bacterium]|nr:hypothetical protein [Gemmatimonadota bacterium]
MIGSLYWSARVAPSGALKKRGHRATYASIVTVKEAAPEVMPGGSPLPYVLRL